MSLQLVIQILVGRENLPKALTLPGRKKKEKEETPVIQNMTPVGLDAFKKNDATYLGDMPSDDDPTVEVVHEGVSYPNPMRK